MGEREGECKIGSSYALGYGAHQAERIGPMVRADSALGVVCIDEETDMAGFRVPHRCAWLACGCVAALLILVGCASQSKGKPASPSGGSPAAAEPAAPQGGQSETPTARGSEAAPATTDNLDQAVRELSASGGGEMTDAQREALVRMIEAAIKAQMQANEAAAPTEPPPSPKAPPPAQPTPAAPPAQPAQSDAAAAQAPAPGAATPANTTAAQKPAAAKNDKGCGPTETGAVVNLTPPPLDAPQPKYVCKEPKLVSEGVWQGETAEFTFKIANEGEGPLAIRLRGG